MQPILPDTGQPMHHLQGSQRAPPAGELEYRQDALLPLSGAGPQEPSSSESTSDEEVDVSSSHRLRRMGLSAACAGMLRLCSVNKLRKHKSPVALPATASAQSQSAQHGSACSVASQFLTCILNPVHGAQSMGLGAAGAMLCVGSLMARSQLLC